MWTPQEIRELMQIMKTGVREKSILDIFLINSRRVCRPLYRDLKGKYIGTIRRCRKCSAMMVGRDVNFHVEKKESKPGEVLLSSRTTNLSTIRITR